jgi:hypothetical protein
VLVVTPRPIFFLLSGRAVTKIHVIAMGFTLPPAVKNHFIVIPNVVITIVSVVNTVTQYVSAVFITTPHVAHALGIFGTRANGAGRESSLICRRLFSVNLVGDEVSLFGLRIVDQSFRATHSATGATARAHVDVVSERRIASSLIKRHDPSRCSKNHRFENGLWVIQSSK